MKKIVLIIALQLLAYSSFSQMVRNENAGFAIHPGHTAAQPDHWTFIWQNNDCYAFDPPPQVTGDVPGWTVSHGHPLPRHNSDVACMGLEHNLEANCGHGVAAIYHFEQGQHYKVILGFCPDVPGAVTDLSHGDVKLRLTQSHPNGRTFNQCCDAIPNPPNSWDLGFISSRDLAGGRQFQFTFQADKDYDYLMVFPEQSLSGVSPTRAIIQFVNVYQFCEENKTVIGDYISNEHNDFYQNIYARST